MIKTCPVCCKRFDGRIDKKCCSAACKKRLQRTPDRAQQLKQAFVETESAMRFIAMMMDDPTHQARATNMMRSIVRSAASYLPDMYRWALAAEIKESVDVSKVG